MVSVPSRFGVVSTAKTLPVVAILALTFCLSVSNAQPAATGPAADPSTGLYHFNQARIHEKNGKWDQAENELRQATFRDPNDYLNFVRLADSLIRSGKTNEAIATYQRAIALSPDDPMLHFSLGSLYESAGQFDTAKREYQTGLQQNPAYIYGQYNLAKVSMQLGEYEAAEQAFKQFLSKYPNHYEAQRYLANVYLVNKKPEQAAHAYEALKFNFPDKFHDSINFARALTQNDSPEAALEELKTAYAKEGNKADILEEMGNAHMALGQDSYAIHNYEQSYELDNNRYPLLLKVADNYQKEKKPEQAAIALKQYLDKDPGNSDIHHWYANVLIQQKHYNQAYTELNQLLDKTQEPKDRYQLNKEIAYVLQSKGDIDDSIKRYESLLSEPEGQLDGQMKTNLAIAYHKTGQLDKAIPLYEAAYNQLPQASPAEQEQKQMLGNDLANALTSLGDKNYQEQKYPEALAQYELATRYAKQDNVLPYVGLGNTYFATQSLDLAKAAYEQSLAKDDNNQLARLYLGKVELQRHDPQQAIRQLEPLVGQASTLELGLKREAFLTLGDAYQQAGKMKDAAESYEKAQAIVLPSNAQNTANNDQELNLLLTQGNLWQQLGRFDKAKSAYEAVLSKDPNNAKAQYNLGIIYNELGQLDASVTAYQSAIKMDPAFNESRYGLAVTYEKQQKYKDALNTYQEYLKSPSPLYGSQAQERIQLIQQALSPVTKKG